MSGLITMARPRAGGRSDRYQPGTAASQALEQLRQPTARHAAFAQFDGEASSRVVHPRVQPHVGIGREKQGVRLLGMQQSQRAPAANLGRGRAGQRRQVITAHHAAATETVVVGIGIHAEDQVVHGPCSSDLEDTPLLSRTINPERVEEFGRFARRILRCGGGRG